MRKRRPASTTGTNLLVGAFRPGEIRYPIRQDAYRVLKLPRRLLQHSRPKSRPPIPHVTRENGELVPEDGYDWISEIDKDFGVKWVPGKLSHNHPNVIASKTENTWDPEDGYAWVTTADSEDHRVKWVPNMPSKSHPNVVTSDKEGLWRPEIGYKFVDPNDHQLRVVGNGLVDSAIRIAAVAISFNDQKGRLEELSKLDQYDRVEAALSILATSCVITDPLAASVAQREILITRAKAELQDLMKQVLRASVYQMSSDIKRSAPFSWNPFGEQQRQLLEQTDHEIFLLEGRAEGEITAPASFREIRSGSEESALEYNSGQALRQLLSINHGRLARGKW